MTSTPIKDQALVEPATTTPILKVKGLSVSFRTEDGRVSAVDQVDLQVADGEVLAVVGESGCGKSVTAMSLAGLLPRSATVEGSVQLDGVELIGADKRTLRSIRGREIAYIFQEPMTSLNPVFTVGYQIGEVLRVHNGLSRSAARKRSVELLKLVGIPSAERRVDDYPHQLSGGMRQRVMIAMALITRPEILIADEPTTALDVTVQAQILELLKKLQAELGMSIIFVTHDLGVVSGLCDRVQVMYAGRIMETADTQTLFLRPRHPYTKALQRSIPALQPKGRELYTIQGMPPDLSKPITGCAFAPRCEYAVDYCRTIDPKLVPVDKVQATACLRVQAGEI
jgi:peptide/nickel transport system ATP-binding protein